MNIIYFLLGIAVGNKFLENLFRTENESRNNRQEMDKGIPVAFFRKTYTTHLKNVDNTQQIKPEDLHININSDLENIQKAAQPNFIALSVLWSHFQALEKNILKQNLPAPWEQYEENKFISNKKNYLLQQKKWKSFLEEIIQDKSWVRWINDSKEVRKRSLIAYKNIH